MTATHVLGAFSLCTALSNVCMEQEVDLDPRDGRAWVRPQRSEDLEQFAGRVVACRSKLVVSNHAYMYTMDDDTTGYGIILPCSGKVAKVAFYSLCSARDGFSGCQMALDDPALEQTPCALRFLTRDEAKRLHGSAGFKRFMCSRQQELSRGVGKFFCTVGDLLEEEREKLCVNQCGTQSWPWQRLLWIGKTDPCSILFERPSELIYAIIKRVVHAQAREKMVTLNLGELLELE
jgi:hypothetical protein